MTALPKDALKAQGWAEDYGIWSKDGARVIPCIAHPGMAVMWPEGHDSIQDLLDDRENQAPPRGPGSPSE